MSSPFESAITKETMPVVTDNYRACLNLPPQSNVLFITDRKPVGDETVDIDRATRIKMVERMHKGMEQDGIPSAVIETDETIDEIPELRSKVYYDQTFEALQELDRYSGNQRNSSTTTVVYLAKKLLGRGGIYDAASNFGLDKKVRFAGSLGFRVGDYGVMLQMDKARRERIAEASNYFKDFFRKHPNGLLNINTIDANDKEHKLWMEYNREHAPFETDLGMLGTPDPIKIPGKNFEYANIPGGEMFAAPYPYKVASGSFSAEGLIFYVNNGLITDVRHADNNNGYRRDKAQEELIKIIQNGGKLPIAELGLGFYAAAGIKTYSNGAVLSREKAGPHLGFGNPVSPTPEADEIKSLAGNFTHTDFVLDRPDITLLNGHNRTIPFYPFLNQ